jgi:hypothetical protein
LGSFEDVVSTFQVRLVVVGGEHCARVITVSLVMAGEQPSVAASWARLSARIAAVMVKTGFSARR